MNLWKGGRKLQTRSTNWGERKIKYVVCDKMVAKGEERSCESGGGEGWRGKEFEVER
jgi:hypothetical protein